MQRTLQRAGARKAIPIIVRLVAAIGGGYAVSAGLAALAARVLPVTTAMPAREAVVLVSMLAFLVYLGLLIWGFAEPSLVRLCLILAAVGIVSWAAPSASCAWRAEADMEQGLPRLDELAAHLVGRRAGRAAVRDLLDGYARGVRPRDRPLDGADDPASGG